MKTSDGIYFAPGILLKKLDLSNKDSLIAAFEKRITGFYLDPIKLLNDKKHAFAAGVIEFAMIDALARYYTLRNAVEDRIVEILHNNFNISRHVAKRVYKKFRNGLLHENRIKECGQFCYELSDWYSGEGGCLIVNPEKLCHELEKYSKDYIGKLKNDEKLYKTFHSRIKDDLEEEIKYFQSN